MKTVGIVLLILGLIGLLLNLIFWLPARFNWLIAVLISIVCLAAIWGGGRLAYPRTEAVAQPAAPSQSISPQAQTTPPAAGAYCPKCGCQVVPGQQFCGGCGSSLVSYCARCGQALSEPSRFCGKCGMRLS